MSQWDKHTRFLDRQQALKELNDLKFAIESLAKLVGQPGSFENENAKNIVTGLRARIEYLHRSFELCLAEPSKQWQIPKGPFEAQAEAEAARRKQDAWVQQMDQSIKSIGPVPPREGESIMAAAQRAIDVSRTSDNTPYVPEGRGRNDA